MPAKCQGIPSPPARKGWAGWQCHVRLAALTAGLLFGCVEGPTGPGSQAPARLHVVVALPPETPAIWFPTGDTLRLLVRRAGRPEPIVDSATVVGGSLATTVVVPLEQGVERFVATAEIRIREAVAFLAFDAVQLRAGVDTGITLAATYVGAGAGAASFTLAARDSAMRRGDTSRVIPNALDSAGGVIPNVPVRFLSVRPQQVTVDPTGLLTAQQVPPDTARVTGYLPMGLEDDVVVRVLPRTTRLVVVGGDGQSGLPGAALAQPIVVRALDDSLAVAGDDITFTPDAGGGDFAPATVRTDSSGEARATWTLGAVNGLQQASVSATGVSPVRLSAFVRGVESVLVSPATATITTAGGTRQLMAEARDAFGDSVPGTMFAWTSSDTAVATVDGTGLATARGNGTTTITAEAGGRSGTATLTVSVPTGGQTRTWVGGDAAGPTDWSVAANWTPASVPSTADTVVIPAGTSVSPVLTAGAHARVVHIRGGSLTLAGHRLTVSDAFHTGGNGAFGEASGRLIMQDPLDTLIVGGSALWWGDSEQGYLTAGVVRVRGDFIQGFGYSSTATFTAAGTHRVVLDGTTPQNVVFGSPALDTAAGHFQELEIANPAGVSFATDGAVRGTATVAAGTVSGAGRTVVIGGSLVDAAGDRWLVTNTTFTGSPTLPARITSNVRTQGGTVLDRDVAITGNLRVAQASLDLAGHTLTVAGDVVTGEDGGFGAGVLIMQDARDTLTVNGDVTFWGSSESGLITAGLIRARGHFTQRHYYSSTASFTASGSNRVLLDGTGPQLVTLDSPGSDAFSAHFQELEIATTGGGVTIAGGLATLGALRVTTPVTVDGAVTVTVGDSLVTTAGSRIEPATLRLGGGMAVGGTFAPITTQFFGAGQVIQGGLGYRNVTVTGSAAFGGSTTIGGTLLITGGTGDLAINGRTVTVTGTLQTGNFDIGTGGVLRMTDPADSLDVQGDAVFDGSAQAGLLTAGVLVLRGDFTQRLYYSSTGSFSASGTHRVVLAGAGPQTITFDTPSPDPSYSHFHTLEVAKPGGSVALAGGVVIMDQLRTGPGGPQAIAGTGVAMTAAGVDVRQLTLDNVPLSLGTGTLTRFDSVTFQGFDPSATQLAIAHPGAATSFTFTGLRFLTTPTTGYYVSATDVAPADGSVLTIDLVGAEPADGSALTATAGGAVVNWTGGAAVWVAMDAGVSFSCGLRTGGAAYCWGTNGSGQLGNGTTTTQSLPTAVSGGLTFGALTTGGEHACALTPAGAAYCWGANAYGQLGDGTASDRLTPVAVAGGLTFTSLSAGEQHTCGVVTGGAAYCWGRNTNGPLGDGTTTDHAAPVVVSGGLAFASVSAAIGQHTCGVTTAGAAYCWGRNTNGQLGDGTTADRTAPAAVSGGLTFAMVSASANEHSCGVTTTGAAYCWGWNNYGEIGDGTTTRRTAPVAVSGGLTFAAVTGGANGFTCGRTTGGAAYCWGLNNAGQLGDGTTTSRTTPVAVAGGLTFTSVDAGFAHVVGVASGGTGHAWGFNGQGQLGDGTTTSRTTPVPVVTPP